MSFYFDRFETRKPPAPLVYSAWRELLYQFVATITLVVGAWYIWWRWTHSLNYDALWFAIPLVLAETFAYIGLVLFTANLWKTKDYPKQPPPVRLSETQENPLDHDQLISVDVFYPTYNEEEELVKLSILDAKKLHYPHPIQINIHVLDDGKRKTMQALAAELGVNYITRNNNMGFKAGNMRNAMEQTHGDFIVICDADTRIFPTFLENTLGYFRDPKVAWVQTPQWFFDLPEGKNLRFVMKKYLWYPGFALGWLIEKCCGPVMIGQDPFVNDPQMFYDVIQRRRNWANASFCCGAGSVHRREAIMEAALKAYSHSIDTVIDEVMPDISKALSKVAKKLEKKEAEDRLQERLREAVTSQIIHEIEMTPYKFHVSEDIYTSIILHSDHDRDWKSVLHPGVECKMLSPQDLQTWTVQRFKYAGGSLDICLNDNPVFKPGLNWRQKLMYTSTFWSYFGGIWNILFLLSPVIYLFTQIAPIASFSVEFYKHIFPFLVLNELATMLGTWGIAGFKSKASYLSFFPVNLRALWTVLRKKQIKFPTTPKERQEGNFFHLVIPQFLVIVLTIAGLAYAGYGYHQGTFTNLNGLLTNIFWGFNNILAMSGLVLTAFWKPDELAVE
ncbi:MAG: cellulose synthase catalytic subunit [Methyloglobulus sp.]|nr:glycosyltransferase [Methyloglobulus sp.]